jgi:EH_Signature domain
MAAPRTALEILGDLDRLSRDMVRDVPPATPSERTLSHLSAVVATMSMPRKARPVTCPADYVALWNSIAPAGGGELPNRAIRYLSWETNIAIQPAFQNVALSQERISSRSLQGIMRSVHRRWRGTHNTESVGRLAVALAGYPGKSLLIEKWRANSHYLLRNDGPTMFARDILREQTSWELKATEWGIEADTEFGQTVLEVCVAHSLKAGRAESEQYRAAVVKEILPSRHWTPAAFKNAIGQLLLASSSQTSQAFQESLKRFVLEDSRLLDPRVPANTPNWAGISEAAKTLLIQWLSASDIRLFFEHVLPTRHDPHGRKAFWLQYTKHVVRSRPLLAVSDEIRWQAGTETQRDRNYGRTEVNSDTSAFLLDFGRILVVEFSKVGNAVFVYQHRDIPGLSTGFWSDARFPIANLKQVDNCVERIVHNVKWQREMRTLLAQYGIHPGA